MAIKGKSKSRANKAVTRGPKPAYVPVKQPLLARRGFWITTAAVIGVLVVAGLWYGFAKEATQNRDRDLTQARSAAFQAYGRQVEPIIGTVGQPVQPANWSSFTQLSDAVDQLTSGKGNAAKIKKTAETVSGQASTAWEALDAIDAASAVRGRGLDQVFVLYVIGSKDKLVDALKLYEQAGALLAMAADAPEGDQRDALVARAQAVADVARSTFDSGFSDYVQASTLAGLFQEASTGSLQTLPAPTGNTGATGPTG